jgi:ClpP class serine protease
MELSGVLTPRFNASAMCGASNFVSTNDAILNYLDLADKFDKILLHVDSQGGAAIGVMEFADAIRNSSAYVVGFTDTVAASGGYWILSACDEVVATPSAVVGSIGVYSAVTKKESSTMKTHYFSAGAKKLYGAKDTPLSDAEASHFQTSVDRMYEQFTSAVALNRGLPVEAIKATEAGTFAASEVVGLLVDRIVNNITEV